MTHVHWWRNKYRAQIRLKSSWIPPVDTIWHGGQIESLWDRNSRSRGLVFSAETSILHLQAVIFSTQIELRAERPQWHSPSKAGRVTIEKIKYNASRCILSPPHAKVAEASQTTDALSTTTTTTTTKATTTATAATPAETTSGGLGWKWPGGCSLFLSPAPFLCVSASRL